MLHFGVQLPYAALAHIQHEWDTDHLNVWVVFPYPMDQDFLPDHPLWSCDVDTVIKNVTASAWQDAFTILLIVNDVLALPGRVLLEYLGPDPNLSTTWRKQWEPWGPILSVNVPYGWEDIIVVDTVNRRVGINATPLARTFEIASADTNQRIQIFHDDTDSHYRWTLGNQIFQTEEGVNTTSQMILRGKGTGYAEWKVQDGLGVGIFTLQATPDGRLQVFIGGSAPQFLSLIRIGNVPIYFFNTSRSGTTQQFRIYGYRAGDALRYLAISVGSTAADSVNFSGVSNYLFAGNLRSLSISSATLTQSAAGPTDNLDVSSVNTVFIDCALNHVTIGGFVGGVDGQVIHIVRLCPSVNNATLEHNEVHGNQRIFLHRGADETLTGEYGGWTLICNGSNWFDVSHAKHV